MSNKLEMMRIFCGAADASSFKEAALRLGISPQAVTRAIKDLEYALGELLFHRNTRQIRITEFGRGFALEARKALADVDNLFTPGAGSKPSEFGGLVRITVPMGIGRTFILPLLRDLSSSYPGIQFDIRLSDNIADVIDEQIDIGIRVGATLKDNGFIAKAASLVAFWNVASPALIKRIGKPLTPQDLLHMPTTGLIAPSSGRAWPWMFARGQQLQINNQVLLTNDSQLEIQAVLDGIGIGQIGSCMAIPYIREGRLIPLLEDYTVEPWTLYVYRPQRGPVAPRVRIVFDYLAEQLANELVFPTTL
ncbi:LysR family transcriptional regulator [Methylovorus menthalis]|uniref:LysR family transcriptional regulator n=1 Tax=Methylovorus menthalis TaxID=1002227 RepID=UPI001E30317A|nr:LysR family transcriptional regulator [Methylovorus menthalis]MCB4811759.1 LysR family transcriptional regulator [Methylovorus menthalis]